MINLKKTTEPLKIKRMAIKRKRDSIGEVDDPNVHPLGTSYADLPRDIVSTILLKLPFKSVWICRFVCKSWQSVISDSKFAQLYFECAPITVLVRASDNRRVSRTLHLLDFDEFRSNETQYLPSDSNCGQVSSYKDSLGSNHDNPMKLEVRLKLPLHDSTMMPDIDGRKRGMRRCYKTQDQKFDVVNSCNGLLCLCDFFEKNPLVVCNPITAEFIILPESENDKLLTHPVYSGFGYLKKTNEYKVIRMYPSLPDCSANGYAAIEIHTLGTQLWRNIKYEGTYWSNITSPTCLNGSLYWLVYDIMSIAILSLDLESETFNTFPCPYAIHPRSTMTIKSRLGFGELNGGLYICGQLYGIPKSLRIWTIKPGIHQLWYEVLRFYHNDLNKWPKLHLPRIGLAHPGILMIYDPPRFFIYYDHQKHLIRSFEGRGSTMRLEAIFHFPSFIRLKDQVKGDNIEVFNVHSRCAASKLQEEKDYLRLTENRADIKDMFCSMDYIYSNS